MMGFLTSRADIEIFGRIIEKEDIVPVEVKKSLEDVSFEIKKSDFIYRLIEKSKVFAISIPTYPLPKEEQLCEMNEGEFTDKFKLCKFNKVECNTIDCPTIKNTRILECDFTKEEQKMEKILIFGKIITTRTA